MDSSSEESIAMEHGVQDGQDQGFRPPTPPPMPHPPPHAPELAGPLIVALPAIEPVVAPGHPPALAEGSGVVVGTRRRQEIRRRTRRALLVRVVRRNLLSRRDRKRAVRTAVRPSGMRTRAFARAERRYIRQMTRVLECVAPRPQNLRPLAIPHPDPVPQDPHQPPLEVQGAEPVFLQELLHNLHAMEVRRHQNPSGDSAGLFWNEFQQAFPDEADQPDEDPLDLLAEQMVLLEMAAPGIHENLQAGAHEAGEQAEFQLQDLAGDDEDYYDYNSDDYYDYDYDYDYDDDDDYNEDLGDNPPADDENTTPADTSSIQAEDEDTVPTNNGDTTQADDEDSANPADDEKNAPDSADA
ncbi:hypothetical protein LSTR_LSTR000546 [Laodelphax striatellus]|uniref:Uncharacterized protein n=1 Tax=Laodelphax striatellus TaxID=195883 RepID=A0A482XGW3_LAOST|nr:hypothetical protein LSTR_LSTR000546 [Laodelphax striatellus]